MPVPRFEKFMPPVPRPREGALRDFDPMRFAGTLGALQTQQLQRQRLMQQMQAARELAPFERRFVEARALESERAFREAQRMAPLTRQYKRTQIQENLARIGREQAETENLQSRFNTDIANLASDENRFRETGRHDVADQLANVRNLKANIRLINQPSTDFGKYIRQRDYALAVGDEKTARQAQEIADRLATADLGKKMTDEEKFAYQQDLKDLSQYNKNAMDEAKISAETLKRIKSFKTNYNKAAVMFRGGQLNIPVLGWGLKGTAGVFSSAYQEMNKDVGWLQAEMMKFLKPGRIAKHIQDLVRSSNLDPSLNPSAVKVISNQFEAASRQSMLRPEFITEAKKRGYTSPIEIDSAWRKYSEEHPVIDRRRNLRMGELNKNVWVKYLPLKTKKERVRDIPPPSDEDIREMAAKYAAQGITEEDIRADLRAKGIL